MNSADITAAANALRPAGKAVDLKEIRPILGGTREEQDAALIAAQRAGRIVLYRNDDTPSITAADHEAALLVGGQPRHLLYVKLTREERRAARAARA